MNESDLWVTDRCAREDLGLDEWPDPEGVVGVQHEVVRKFRERRKVDPEPRNLYINDLSEALGRPCFELKHERIRGATWFDRQNEVVYLLAAGLHASESRRDVYDRMVDLARQGRILPTAEDEAELQLYRAGRWLRELRETVGPQLRAAAMNEPGVPFSRDLGQCEVTLVMDRYEGAWFAQLRIDSSGAGARIGPRQSAEVAVRLLGPSAEMDESSVWYGIPVPWPTRVYHALLVEP